MIRDFIYLRANTIEEALDLLEEHKDASGAIDYVKIDYGNQWVPPGWVPYSTIEKK